MLAVVDWFSLFSEEFFLTRAKLATIWFDKIVLQVPRKDFVGNMIEALAKRDGTSTETQEALYSVWKSPHDFLPRHEFVDPNIWDRADQSIRDSVSAELQSQVRATYGTAVANTFGEQREIALGGAGYLSAIEIWKNLNAMEPSTFVANTDGSKLFDAAVESSVTGEGFHTFSRVASIPIPNLASVSWDHVVDLRNSKYLDNFRTTLNRIGNQISSLGDAELADLVDNLKSSEMERIVRANEPKLGVAILNGLLDNIPGLPINPYSVGKSALHIKKSIEEKRQSGWLYFLLKMQDSSK